MIIGKQKPFEEIWDMIKDFKKMKDQLRELAEIINSFNSESVQLKSMLSIETGAETSVMFRNFWLKLL